LIAIARDQAILHYFGAKVIKPYQPVPSLGRSGVQNLGFPLGTAIANDLN